LSELQQHIKRIQDKLQQLLKQYHLVQKENEKLQVQLQQSKENENTAQQRTEELLQQVTFLKAAKTGLNDSEKKDFEKRINQQLKELDKCISLLSQ
jgi:hypothetical protein